MAPARLGAADERRQIAVQRVRVGRQDLARQGVQESGLVALRPVDGHAGAVGQFVEDDEDGPAIPLQERVGAGEFAQAVAGTGADMVAVLTGLQGVLDSRLDRAG